MVDHRESKWKRLRRLFELLSLPGWLSALWGAFWKVIGWLGNIQFVHDNWRWVEQLSFFKAASLGNIPLLLGIIWLIVVLLWGDELRERFEPWKIAAIGAAALVLVTGVVDVAFSVSNKSTEAQATIPSQPTKTALPPQSPPSKKNDEPPPLKPNPKAKERRPSTRVTKTPSNGGSTKTSQPAMALECAPGANCAISNGQQGGITGQVFIDTHPLPTVTFVEEQLPAAGQKENPGVKLKISIDHSFSNPEFVALCDRPCQSIQGGLWDGASSTSVGVSKSNPRVVVLEFEMPNTLFSNNFVTWEIRSNDDSPIHIERIKPIARR